MFYEKNTDCSIIEPLQIVGELLDEALVLPNVSINDVNKNNFDTLIAEISKAYGVEPSVALVGLFCTLQAGGTTNAKRSCVRIFLLGTRFESRKINPLIIKNLNGVTPRQLAKKFCDQIQLLAVKYNIVGNAYLYLNKFHSELLNVKNKDLHEKQWCSDFQMENSNCPEYIRVALKKRYNEKFGKIKY